MTDQIDTSASTALVAAAERPTSNGNGRIVWPDGPAKKQYFSLPDNIIYYMIQNPSSPEGYLKLAMSCKYFFEKKPLLIVANIYGDKFCSSEDRKECHKKKYKCCVKINLAELTIKIWLTHQYCYYDIPSFNTLLLQKLYKCGNAELKCLMETIDFANFKLVASCFEKISLFHVEMVDKDGNAVQLEEILGSLPNVKEFEYLFKLFTPAVTASTMTNICNLANFNNLRLLQLKFIPELFNVKDFENLIMKHKDTRFCLDFYSDISAAYRAQLDGLFDTVIKSECSNCVIWYTGQDIKKICKLYKRYEN